MTNLTNVTRSLAINAYQFLEAKSEADINVWFDEQQEKLSDERLEWCLTKCNNLLGTQVLSVSSTAYAPRGASAALLIGQVSIAHLDASHISAHSYFDHHGRLGLVRLEMEVSSCGGQHPLIILPWLPDFFPADYIQIDYRERGLQFDAEGLLKHPETNLRNIDLHNKNLHDNYLTNHDLQAAGYALVSEVRSGSVVSAELLRDGCNPVFSRQLGNT